MISLLWLMTALGWAQDDVAPPAEGMEASVEEAATGPDRTSPPAVVPAEWLELDEAEVHDLGDGRMVHLVRIPGVRMVEMTVVLHQGYVELGGRSALTEGLGSFLAQATTTRSARDLELLGDLNELSVDGFMSAHAGGASLTVPADGLDLGLDVLGDVLRNPAFPAADVKRESRERHRNLTLYAPTSLSSSAYYGLTHGWYGPEHPYGQRPDVSGWKKLRSADLRAAHSAWITEAPMTALIVGDVEWSDIQPSVTAALEGVGIAGERPERAEGASIEGHRVVAIDMPGQQQASVMARFAAPSLTHEDHAAMRQTNWVFGGHFLSRLNANLREDKGFTYGSWSGYSSDLTYGLVTISVDVKGENVGATMAEIRSELTRIVADGVTSEELDMAREDAVSTWNGTRETARTADRLYSSLHFREQSIADARALRDAYEAVTPEQSTTVGAQWLGPDAGVLWVVAGDRAVLEPQLQEEAEVLWVTPEQAVLGAF